MDPVRNPFTPGAGTQPPELAGRESILNDATIAIQRANLNKPNQSQMLLGLRGVGKTVLLNKIEEIALNNGHLTIFIEAPEQRPLAVLITPKIAQILRKLSFNEDVKGKVHSALKAVKSFIGSVKLEYAGVAISVDPEPGVADSGDFEADFSELMVIIGETAKAAGKPITILIDEVQYLSEKDLAALIVALHKINQKNLPVLFFGAGLPQVAALSGEAKSYSERLFHYPPVGPLGGDAAMLALKHPIENEDASIQEEALNYILRKTQGYPYFLQEWGFQVWNICETGEITLSDAEEATEKAEQRLDDSFFNARFSRLTPKERQYVIAMANLGSGPLYKSSDVADMLSQPLNSLGPCRSKIIHKGMIYSPSHGDIAFTVPLFNEYLNRCHPNIEEGYEDNEG